MLYQRRRRKLLPGHPFDKLRRRVPLPMTMDLLPQPLPQRAKLAAGESARRVRLARGRPWRKTARHRDFQASTWGNSPPAPRSSEHPASRRRHQLIRDDAQVLPIFVVPGRRCVGRGQVAGKQRLLHLETNEDVQVVSRFVGLDANQRRPNVVDGEVKRLAASTPPSACGKLGLRCRVEMPPECPAAAHQIFPHPRLRFVDAQRNGLAERHAESIGRQPLLVDAVTRLVQDAEEGRVEEVSVVAGRDAAVVRAERCAEGMAP